MDRLTTDLRLALRRLRRNPAFTAVAILTLALGIGANASIFSVINAILVRPLPVRDSSRLVSLNQSLGNATFPVVSYPNYRDLSDRNHSLDGLMAYRIAPASLGQAGNSQRIWGYIVTGNYFDVLGVQAVQGRLLTPGDDHKPGAHPVAVVSYNCWQKRFGGNPALIGSTVNFNGMPFTILGVTPREFFGTELFYKPEVFFPMMMQKELEGHSYLDQRSAGNTFVAGRLKPGVTMSQAESELNAIARRLAEEYPSDNAGLKIVLTPPGLAGSFLRGSVIGFAAALFGVSALVLLIACTNLASMLLARAADRRKETAIRLALGAGRLTLIRQLLIENLVVALAGGALGALVAVWIAEALTAWRPPTDIPIVIAANADIRVFLFSLFAAGIATLLFGLAPALQSTRTDLVPALKSEATIGRRRFWHLRDYMVVTQIALSAVLLVCSVLVVRSLQRALDAPIGYNPRGAATASFDLNIQGYTADRSRQFERRVLDKLRSMPGIDSAAIADALPLSLDTSNNSIYVEGKPVPKAASAPLANVYVVSEDYFKTMQTRMLAGREFDVRDKPGGKRVAIVNHAFAEKLVGTGDAIGKRFGNSPTDQLIEIVGIVEDGKYFSLNESHQPAYWAPLEMNDRAAASIVARTRLDTDEALRQIRAAVRDADPNVALYETGSLSQLLDLPLFPARVAAGALGAFGLLVLVLAATGIYGVMAYAVARRTREIGIRMAIGASPGQVFVSVARSAAALVGAGTSIGLVLALALAKLLTRILYGVEPGDPGTYVIVLAIMASIAAVACWAPARRATNIEPLRALRME